MDHFADAFDTDKIDHYVIDTSRAIRNVADGWVIVVRGAEQLLTITYTETEDGQRPGSGAMISIPPYAARLVAKALIEIADQVDQ